MLLQNKTVILVTYPVRNIEDDLRQQWFCVFFVTDLRVRFFVRKSLISEVWGLKQDENPDSGSVPR